MVKIILLILLPFTLQQSILIQSDLQNQTASENKNLQSYPQASETTKRNQFPFPNQFLWVWSTDFIYANPSNLTITETFQIVCSNPIQIFVNVDDHFNASFNGNRIMSATSHATVLNSTISSSQFMQTNTLVVDGWNNGYVPGLAYQVIQDQGGYEKECGTAFFNSETCQYYCQAPSVWQSHPICECSCPNQKDCKAPLVWYGYPVCECNCPYSQMCGPGFSWNGKRSSYKHAKS